MIALERAHTHAHTHTHTQHISSSIANLTASWYFIKIKYSEPNISAPASVSRLAFAVLLLAVIKQCCIAAVPPSGLGVNCLYLSWGLMHRTEMPVPWRFGTNTCTMPPLVHTVSLFHETWSKQMSIYTSIYLVEILAQTTDLKLLHEQFAS